MVKSLLVDGWHKHIPQSGTTAKQTNNKEEIWIKLPWRRNNPANKMIALADGQHRLDAKIVFYPVLKCLAPGSGAISHRQVIG